MQANSHVSNASSASLLDDERECLGLGLGSGSGSVSFARAGPENFQALFGLEQTVTLGMDRCMSLARNHEEVQQVMSSLLLVTECKRADYCSTIFDEASTLLQGTGKHLQLTLESLPISTPTSSSITDHHTPAPHPATFSSPTAASPLRSPLPTDCKHRSTTHSINPS